jgi:exodeoxyribonuclease V gamma subunit
LKILIHRNGANYGPYSEDSLRGFLEAGHVGPEDLACRSGSEEWVLLGDLLGEQGEEATAEIPEGGLSDEEVLEYARKVKTLVEADPEEPIASSLAQAPGGQGITLYGSNDPEELIERCASDLSEPLSNPFKTEEFLVQSRGMNSWIKLQLADRLGVFANVEFRFPEETIWMILRGFLGEGPKKNPYTKEGMSWKIFDLLPGLMKAEEEVFASVARYVGPSGEINADRAFRLCWQVATLFDSYQAYRPEMIMDWQAGRMPEGVNRWQGVLWQVLRQAFEMESLPELVRRLQAVGKPAEEDWLPERLSVFGISTMPPIFLDVLQAYGRFRPLRIYALQPAPVMWGEVESEKTLQKRWKARALERAQTQFGRTVAEDELNEERGNPLIASLGRTGREFFNLLVDRDAHDEPLDFRDPSGDSLLARLQRWTFEVFSEQPEERKPLAEGDESITINSCHGPMREAEVVRDYLLRRFADDRTLRPRDIVVMMPDPEGYAPYLRATFGGMEKGMPEHFPYSIVDREPRQESQLVDCFFDLLEFFDGRATNREVLDLLDSTVFRAKFELEDEDIEAFRDWIRDCHAHWGLNGEHRERFGSVKTDEHTWRRALDRMALGFCMRSNGDRIWEGSLPYDEIEGENALRFGKLFKVINALTELEVKAGKEQTLVSWVEFLEKLTDEFFPSNNETLMDRRRVQKAIRALSDEYSKLAEKSVVPLRVVRYHLNNVLDVGSPQGQFLTSGVTFCGLRPMRSVNARVICLIGMDDGAFPRQTRKPSFDLSGDRKPGDRSAREDDRYLFLETIWCAREHLYVSYVGQSIRQSQKIPPSVVVNELLDGLDKLADFGIKAGKPNKARDELVCVQTLHPFAKENYTRDKLMRSYSGDNLEAAKALLHPDEETPPFVSEKMSEPEDKLADLTMEDLIRFFESPAEVFLKERLGMSLWDEDSPPDECEPLDLGHLEKYVIKDRLLGIALELEEEADLLALERAEGGLPPGSLGEVWFNESKREVEQFLEQWGEDLKGEKEDPVIIDVEFNGIRLRGELGPFVNRRQVLYRCVKEIKGKDRLRTWIRHLFASAFGEGGGVETRFYSSDKKYLSLKPMAGDSARERVKNLIELFERGMREPLPFFPEASFAFESERLNPSPEKKGEETTSPGAKALVEARNKWNSGHNHTGEGEYSANQLCFREEPFEDSAFANLATEIYGPFIKSSGSEEEGEE